ncbi:MAG: hypothetical protein JNJ59_20940 [Deltaproteobacteria bacterium]|nr:hypothetical protein [Deltaproteobacteria bacterium]
MPPMTDSALSEMSFAHLQSVVAIDSQSDEHSTTIPSSPGQVTIADFVAAHFARCGASVERDPHANVIATFPGRGRGANAPTIAMMVHLDTARGTSNPPRLNVRRTWDGAAIPYPDNAALQVDVTNYPGLAEFLGHDVVFGGGVTPFGLDDKLGLTHLMTLAAVLGADPSIEHPPLLLIGRPDEEIGRMEAIEGLAELLAARGVRSGYTIDGILPFEVNVANFNAAHAAATFSGDPLPPALLAARDHGLVLHLGGVNTHGATAFDEGHRTAVRFAAELFAAAADVIVPLTFASDALRDCDAVFVVGVAAHDLAAARAQAEAIVAPHIKRGASLRIESLTAPELAARLDGAPHDGVAKLLAAVSAFAETATPEHPLWCEDSRGWQGYSHCYRARTTPDGAALDVRIRDFVPASLEARKAAIRTHFAACGATVSDRDQYIDMSPRLADRRDLVDVAVLAGQDVGVAVREQPIRGGTGVDPFLARGTAIANLGTGYFAPESEKELTSLQLMAAHVRWLVALLARLAAS